MLCSSSGASAAPPAVSLSSSSTCRSVTGFSAFTLADVVDFPLKSGDTTLFFRLDAGEMSFFRRTESDNVDFVNVYTAEGQVLFLQNEVQLITKKRNAWCAGALTSSAIGGKRTDETWRGPINITYEPDLCSDASRRLRGALRESLFLGLTEPPLKSSLLEIVLQLLGYGAGRWIILLGKQKYCYDITSCLEWGDED